MNRCPDYFSSPHGSSRRSPAPTCAPISGVSVGDALDDLVEEMLKVDTFANTSKFFNDPSCLANRFGDRHTSRKLTWVLLTEPVTSSTMYQAIGGVVLSGGLVFLPGLLGRAI